MFTLAMIVLVLLSLAWFGGPTRHPNRNGKSWCAVLLLSLLSFGCTSMQRVEKPSEDLQKQIRAGNLLHKGQDVALVTNEGKEVWFRFQRIDNDAVVGHTQLGEEGSVPIVDIAGVTTDRFSVGRTAAVVGGGYALIVSLLFAAFAIAY